MCSISCDFGLDWGQSDTPVVICYFSFSVAPTHVFVVTEASPPCDLVYLCPLPSPHHLTFDLTLTSECDVIHAQFHFNTFTFTNCMLFTCHNSEPCSYCGQIVYKSLSSVLFLVCQIVVI